MHFSTSAFLNLLNVEPFDSIGFFQLLKTQDPDVIAPVLNHLTRVDDGVLLANADKEVLAQCVAACEIGSFVLPTVVASSLVDRLPRFHLLGVLDIYDGEDLASVDIDFFELVFKQPKFVDQVLQSSLDDETFFDLLTYKPTFFITRMSADVLHEVCDRLLITPGDTEALKFSARDRFASEVTFAWKVILLRNDEQTKSLRERLAVKYIAALDEGDVQSYARTFIEAIGNNVAHSSALFDIFVASTSAAGPLWRDLRLEHMDIDLVLDVFDSGIDKDPRFVWFHFIRFLGSQSVLDLTNIVVEKSEKIVSLFSQLATTALPAPDFVVPRVILERFAKVPRMCELWLEFIAPHVEFQDWKWMFDLTGGTYFDVMPVKVLATNNDFRLRVFAEFLAQLSEYDASVVCKLAEPIVADSMHTVEEVVGVLRTALTK